jgi:hypothetical protein
MIKRFKFLVIIFILSIDRVINCGDFERDLNNAIRLYNDFSKLKPEQEACYLPQIGSLAIDFACSYGNVSAFKWLLSNGIRPDRECFENAITSDDPKSEIVSDLLCRGCYTEYIGDTTLKSAQDNLDLFGSLVDEDGDLFQGNYDEAQKICVMIRRYEDRVGLRTAWNAAVVSAGANYAGSGSGVVGVREIKE